MKKKHNTYKKNQKYIDKKKLYFIPMVLVSMVLIIVLSSSLRTNATEKQPTKFYTSIQIENGDTLWSIAEEHKPAYITVSDYIDDLMSINNLTNDDIHAGNYLTIYYCKE